MIGGNQYVTILTKYGEYIRGRYTEEIHNEYWKERFGNYKIDTIGFNTHLNRYLLWGFNLEKLCGLVDFYDENSVPLYEKFINKIMDTKLYLKDKNCEDLLKIDQNDSQPYGVDTLIAQFIFASAQNKKVDRYIPIEEIKKVLIKEIGDKCDVECIINEYIKKESEEQEPDLSEVFSEVINIKKQNIMDTREKYNITTCEDLRYYEAGDSIEPQLLEILKSAFVFYESIVEEDLYKELMKKPPIERCKWLVLQNTSIIIRDQDWNKIFSDIHENENAFSRYYPMVRWNFKHIDSIYMVIAIILNKDLYTFCKENK